MKGAGLHSEGRTDKWVQTSTLTGANISYLHLYGCKRALGARDCGGQEGAGIVTFWACKIAPVYLSVI